MNTELIFRKEHLPILWKRFTPKVNISGINPFQLKSALLEEPLNNRVTPIAILIAQIIQSYSVLINEALEECVMAEKGV